MSRFFLKAFSIIAICLAASFVLTGISFSATVYGTANFCDSGDDIKCGANINSEYCPFTGFLSEVGNHSNRFRDSGDIFCDFVWEDVPPGTYWVYAVSSPGPDGIWASKYGCATQITVGDDDEYFVTTYVVLIPY